MQIEIWSDVVCPWCFIGKRRLEKALQTFPHADEVEIVYRSFELDPTAPEVGTETVSQSLQRKYGGDVETMMRQVSELAEAEGLRFAYEDKAMHTKTVDAHRLLQLARVEGAPGAQAALKEALLSAYFLRGESMGDHEVLRTVAVSVGLDATRVDAVLAGEEFTAEVHADITQARDFGATGVPFFVFDRKYGLAGAHAVEAFSDVLQQAWDDRHSAAEN